MGFAMKIALSILVLICSVCLMSSGCIKGPLWRTGYISPWAQQRWAEEEQIAPTLFAKRDELAAMVRSANKGSPTDRERTAAQLAQIAQNDPILLLRLEAVKLLGDLDTTAARDALMVAAKDPQSDVRMAAVYACSKGSNPESVPILQDIIGGDSDVDIRLAATRTLEGYRGPEAVRALALALDDPDPALQLRGADSLQVVTGKNLGHDVRAWQEYVRQSPPIDNSADTLRVAEDSKNLDAITR